MSIATYTDTLIPYSAVFVKSNLGDELKSFIKGLNLPTEQVSLPSNGRAAQQQRESKQQENKTDKSLSRLSAGTIASRLTAKSASTTRVVDCKRAKKLAKEEEEEKRIAEALRFKAGDSKKRKANVEAIVSKVESTGTSKKPSASQLLLTPTSQWMDTPLEPLEPANPVSPTSSSTASLLSHHQLVSLLSHGNLLVETDNMEYHSLLNSGSAKLTSQLGGLSPSDAKFISSLLGNTPSISASAGQSGTLSDRIAAHALLLGSSPIHNLRSLDALVAMSAKKNREESSRATRALADWFAGSGLGTSGHKLRYFRDQPELVATAAAPFSPSRDQRLALFAYEDRLKKTYFAFLQILEMQLHDPLPFVRQQAVAQIFILLREKSEQEQNLLRLLVNKLGDGDRAVASKATNNLLELLNVHPNMKGIVACEVSELIHKPNRSTNHTDRDSKKRHQTHAKYYGVLMLNQIVLTRQDADVANLLVSLYFELFEDALNMEAFNKRDEDSGPESKTSPAQRKQKNRWHHGKRGKPARSDELVKVVQDSDGKTMAAILTGVRRAFPFANLETSVFDKHMNTLFRITHSSSFNIAVQALQLIYVVATSSQANSTHLMDRFHSSLYSSMLDPRLGSTSKTAMYLNMCYKAMRDDVDDDRRAAEIKRLIQILAQMDVEFVCGALFLIGELIRAHPQLHRMLVNAEDDDEEIIVDPPEDEGTPHSEWKQRTNARLAIARSRRYDMHKRDPRFAKAGGTCLWEIAPLLEHFHPTVRLLAAQLVRNEPLTTTPDLTLYSLSYFLDRFVYRNAKKGTVQKGTGGMQPAVAACSDGEVGVRKVKGWAGSENDEVNTEQFWKRKSEDVPVDSLFFHHYFILKRKRDAKAAKKSSEQKKSPQEGGGGAEDIDPETGDDAHLGSGDIDAALQLGAGGSQGSSAAETDEEENDEDEKEIWKAMKASMPEEDGNEGLLSDSGDDYVDDDEDLAMYDYSDSEGEDNEEPNADGDAAAESTGSASSYDEGVFEEDEDDLLPFAEFGSKDDGEADSAGAATSQKHARGADKDEEEEKGKSRSQLRRAERKKRKAMPTFASAEDYAHLLGAEDDRDM